MATAYRELTETGVEELDQQHRLMLQCLDEFLAAVASGCDRAGLHVLFADLAVSAVQHFVQEDRCMAAGDCPMAAANSAAHRHFVARLGSTEVQAELHGATQNVWEALADLRAWLITHIGRCDSKLRAFVTPSSREPDARPARDGNTHAAPSAAARR